jgi:hypothetical protein
LNLAQGWANAGEQRRAARLRERGRNHAFGRALRGEGRMPERPRHKKGPGQVQQFDGKYSRLYVLRTPDNVARAFIFPLQNGRVGLPDRVG